MSISSRKLYRASSRNELLPYLPPDWPDFSGYTRLTITNANASQRLDPAIDYLITGGEVITVPGGVQLSDGRNVVILGLDIEIPRVYRTSTMTTTQFDTARRGLSLNKQRGLVHVEGVYIHPANDPYARVGDAVQINGMYSPGYTFQLCRFEGLGNYEGETYSSASTRTVTTAPTLLHDQGPYATTMSNTTAACEITNNGTSTLYVDTTSQVSSGAGISVAPGVMQLFEVPVSGQLWGISESGSLSVRVNSGGNHPDGIQHFDSTSGTPQPNKHMRLSHVYIETNYQGIFDQASTNPTLSTVTDHVIISGNTTKDGVQNHGILFWPGSQSTKTLSTTYFRSFANTQYKETYPGGALPTTTAPGAERLTATDTDPFDPAPISRIGLSYNSQLYHE